MIYLDHAATTKPSEAVVRTVHSALEECFANPSAVHRLGVQVRARLERDREDVARFCGVDPLGVCFTSGGTESNQWVVERVPLRPGRNRIVTSIAEHPSLREAIRAREGAQSVEVPLRPDGSLDLRALEEALDPSVALVALFAGQNEIGTQLPVADVGRLVRERSPRAHLHLDCVQTFGKGAPLPVAVADSCAVSAHKVHGPKGVGALVAAKPGRLPAPLLLGGGQERGHRGGTENVPGILGFAEAVRELARRADSDATRIAALRDQLETRIRERVADVRVLAATVPRLPHVSSVVVNGVLAKVLLHHLEAEGVLASAGAACQSRKKTLSPALLSLGLSEEEVRSTVRFSLGRDTSPEEVERCAEVLETLVPRLRRPEPAR